MHLKNEIILSRAVAILALALVITPQLAYAKPEKLSVLLAPKKIKKGAKVEPVQANLLSDYHVYWRGQKTFEAKKLSNLSEIESVEHSVLSEKMSAPVRTLEKDLEELFWSLELKRGEAAVSAKNYTLAIRSFQRGLSGLSQLKWPYFWRDSSSVALAKICTLNKKVKNEQCLQLAKKVADVFPKNASETKVLRDLPSFDSSSAAEATGERLSQPYPADRTDKDEKDFELVLAAYFSENKRDLTKAVEGFLKDYPRSSLRFRAQFLIAELATKKGDLKEAEPVYQMLKDQTPLGYYGLVSAERLKLLQKDKVKPDPLMVDSDNFNFNAQEKLTLQRIEELAKIKKYDEIGNEIDSFQRTRGYTSDAVIYLIGIASKYKQSLSGFRLISELIQRQYAGVLSAELVDSIFPYAYEKEITDVAKNFKLDPLWVMSLMKQESGFRSFAISSSGALGLMQLMPSTALDVDPKAKLMSLKGPAANIAVGTKYLASLIEKYDGNLPYALAAYNAGPHRVNKWKKDLKPDATMTDYIESIPFKETREYVMAILRNRYWYQVRKGISPTSLFDTWKL